jgi:IS30 family transposase
LTLHERDEISIALVTNPDESWAEIGRLINRHPTTVSREVKANGDRSHYRPAGANDRARKNLRRKRARHLSLLGPLRDRIIAELKLGRLPVAIWADLRAEGLELVCVETIYTSLFAVRWCTGHQAHSVSSFPTRSTTRPSTPVRQQTTGTPQHRTTTGDRQRSSRAGPLGG